MTVDISCEVHDGSGWLDLDDPAGGFELHADTQAKRRQAWRKTMAENQWTEGEYAIAAVRGNTDETIAVWVHGADGLHVVRELVDDLVAAFSQLRYEVRMHYGTRTETWTCMPADYEIDSSRDLAAANLALVTFTVPRLPAVVVS